MGASCQSEIALWEKDEDIASLKVRLNKAMARLKVIKVFFYTDIIHGKDYELRIFMDLG